MPAHRRPRHCRDPLEEWWEDSSVEKLREFVSAHGIQEAFWELPLSTLSGAPGSRESSTPSSDEPRSSCCRKLM
eukprot:2734664-Heterocapsa_arctica.AAC.1